MMKTAKASIALLAGLLLLVTAAVAAETKSPSKAQYKKVTGDVVSVSQTAIVVKSKVKGDMTLALTEKTDMAGAKAKAGDRVRVNYRQDKKGLTATRIEVLPAAGAAKQTAAAPKTANAAPGSKTVK